MNVKRKWHYFTGKQKAAVLKWTIQFLFKSFTLKCKQNFVIYY